MDAAAILEVLDDHGFGHRSDAKKMRFVQYAVDEILDAEDWAFLLYEEVVETDIAAERLMVLADFKYIISATDVDNARVLIPMERQQMHRRWPGELTKAGTPLYYWFGGLGQDSDHNMDMNLYPIPDALIDIRVVMKTAQNALTPSSAETAIVLPEKYHMMIVHRALVHLYAQDDELDNSQFFQSLYESELNKMRIGMNTTQLDRPKWVAIDHFPDGGFIE